MAKTFGLHVTVTSWYDGDTFKGVLDFSCRIYWGTLAKPQRFRCGLIACPEAGAPGGLEAMQHALYLAPPGDYPVTSTGLDNYGRPLLDLHLWDGRLFSTAMLAAGHAVPYR